MKTKITNFRNGIMLLMLFGSLSVFAQAPVFTAPISTPTGLQVGTQVKDSTLVVVDDAVLFYNPATSGPSFVLTASTTDHSTPVQTFTSYSWVEVTKVAGNEVEGAQLGTTGTLDVGTAVLGLAPGYHKYRVYGFVDDGGVACESTFYQDMIVFVLPPLTPTASLISNGTNTNGGAYCANNVPASDDAAYTFSPTVVFDSGVSMYDSGYSNPAVSDFTYNYRWYAIKASDPTTQIALGTNSTSEAAIFTDPGTYTFFVDVEYASSIKAKGTRTYVTYNAQVLDGSSNPITVTVYATPGTPHITIGSVND